MSLICRLHFLAAIASANLEFLSRGSQLLQNSSQASQATSSNRRPCEHRANPPSEPTVRTPLSEFSRLVVDIQSSESVWLQKHSSFVRNFSVLSVKQKRFGDQRPKLRKRSKIEIKTRSKSRSKLSSANSVKENN